MFNGFMFLLSVSAVVFTYRSEYRVLGLMWAFSTGIFFTKMVFDFIISMGGNYV